MAIIEVSKAKGKIQIDAHPTSNVNTSPIKLQTRLKFYKFKHETLLQK